MASKENLDIRWDDFAANLSSALHNLRGDENFTDLTLVCADQQVEVHKVVLASSSKFFWRVLKNIKHSHPLIYLRGIKFKDLEAVLSFMYLGQVNLAQEHLYSFLALAEELEMKGLPPREKISNADSNRQIQKKSCAEQLREPTSSHPPVLMVPLKAVTVKRKALEMKVAELEAKLKRKENEEADKRGALEMKVAKLEAKLKLKENEVRILHSAMANVTSDFSRSGSNDQSESAFTFFALDEGCGIGAVASSFDLRSNDESLQSVPVKGFGHEPRPAVHFLDPTPARAPSPGVPLPQSAGSGGSKRSGEKLPFTNNHFNSEFLQMTPPAWYKNKNNLF